MNAAFKSLMWALLCAWTGAVVVAQEAPAPAPVANSNSNAQSDAGEPRANVAAERPAVPAKNAAAIAAGSKAPSVADRLSLGTATVTGDREQPKVMYIVPWKSSSIGDSSGKPMNSLLDEALAPVDRDEFKREVAYYDAVRGEAPQNNASQPVTDQGEK